MPQLLDLSELPLDLVPFIVAQIANRRDLYALQRASRAFFVPCTKLMYNADVFGPVKLDSERLRRFGESWRLDVYRGGMKRVRVQVTRVVGCSGLTKVRHKRRTDDGFG
jgi:hypothetical protein